MTQRKNPKAYKEIRDALERHGFKKMKDGSMHRQSTGCLFIYESLKEYDSAEQFFVEYPFYE